MMISGEKAVELLKKIKEQTGWSGHEIATRLGTSANVVYHWLEGRQKPRLLGRLAILRLYEEVCGECTLSAY